MKQAVSEILAFFPGWETTKFPLEGCVQPTTEEGVLESTQEFLCVVVDTQRDEFSWGELRKLRPYTAVLPEDCPHPTLKAGDLLYGWSDGHNVFDHIERDIHDDNERVVAWIPWKG